MKNFEVLASEGTHIDSKGKRRLKFHEIQRLLCKNCTDMKIKVSNLSGGFLAKDATFYMLICEISQLEELLCKLQLLRSFEQGIVKGGSFCNYHIIKQK